MIPKEFYCNWTTFLRLVVTFSHISWYLCYAVVHVPRYPGKSVQPDTINVSSLLCEHGLFPYDMSAENYDEPYVVSGIICKRSILSLNVSSV